MHKKIIVFFLLLLLVTPTLIAGVSTNSVPESNTAGFSPQVSPLASSVSSVKFLARSFFYIIIFFGLIMLMIKFVLPRSMANAARGPFRILQKLSLEVHVTLYLIQAGEKVLLLGVGNKNITLLKEVPKEEVEVLLQNTPPKPLFEPFKEQLAKFLKDKTK